MGMEYAPNNMHQMIRGYADIGLTMPTEYAKLYTYQMFRALGYMHALGLCHRDIKPRNLLVYPNWGVLKLCDFGSAKNLNDGRPNALYICSRHYRAPELLFGTRNYTVAVDIWSAGCVYAELILGRILYPGKTVAEQRNLVTRQLPKELIEIAPPDVVELVISTLSLKASLRPSAFESCAYRCYDQLRYGDILIPNDQPLPPLFNFNHTEVKAAGILIKELLPRQLL
ncbi:uncharacterized protein LOC126902065 [Daktulosphaira vitifoliae]|uniref:uncharacterized protein LOC126902065 n=1 Tax=Daktulosphaira vitifoliae TaxID=58002 RepID=UPI0021AAFA03|nr:uncharacterized protein LOC126902065 [Daktulosphaira vitifoliae]